jgi:hypothetical protein
MLLFSNDTLDEFSRFAKELNETIDRTVRPLIEFQKEMDNIFESDGFTQLTRTFKDLGEQIRQAADEVGQYKSIIVELGYPPHESLPLGEMRMIVQDYNNHGIEYVKAYIDPLMEKIYDELFLEDLLKQWEKSDLVSDRLSILRSAIRCHKQQLFSASIPTLLPQLEGIIGKGFDHSGWMGGKILKVYIKYLLQLDKTQERFFSFEEALRTYYLRYIINPSFEYGKDVESEISRNAILHGYFLEYGNKENSLKIILLFDFLLTTLSNLGEETIQKAKDELYKK